MRGPLAALALWLALVPAAQAGPREEALAVVDRWAAAFAASDVDAIVGLYAPDALFLGTGSREVVSDPAGVRRYFEAALLNRRPRGAAVTAAEVRVISEDAAVVVGLDRLSGVVDGATVSTTGRFTFVVARRGQDWKIIHFHRSPTPP
jgi:uncharacterized protein (TIGR02246 family)